MTIEEKLKFLANSKHFTVMPEEEGYLVIMNDSTFAASIKLGEATEYFLTECCNSISNWLEIDLGKLRKLEEFVKLLEGEK